MMENKKFPWELKSPPVGRCWGCSCVCLCVCSLSGVVANVAGERWEQADRWERHISTSQTGRWRLKYDDVRNWCGTDIKLSTVITNNCAVTNIIQTWETIFFSLMQTKVDFTEVLQTLTLKSVTRAHWLQPHLSAAGTDNLWYTSHFCSALQVLYQSHTLYLSSTQFTLLCFGNLTVPLVIRCIIFWCTENISGELVGDSLICMSVWFFVRSKYHILTQLSLYSTRSPVQNII